MLLHLLGIFNASLLQHYLFLEDLQSFDRTCSKEPDQITVLCDVQLQSQVTGGFTQVRIGNLINQSATSCAISIPPCSKTLLSKKLSKMWPGDGCVNHKLTDQEVLNKTKVRIYLCKIYFVFISFVWGGFVRGVFGKGGFCPGGFCPGVYVRGFLSGGFCPDTFTNL